MTKLQYFALIIIIGILRVECGRTDNRGQRTAAEKYLRAAFFYFCALLFIVVDVGICFCWAGRTQPIQR